ncbi:DUF2897 family protein [Vibrio cholerae]|uniref:DUF2897 family protein n=1 Tax=Vibrio TaxID=662 RepID=UPI00021AA34F|nr:MULTISPECIES: DUF2897 family protein [Vibrio]EGS57502.1 hypothetical protein VCHE09_2489 [Vibrio paracholerae HE-09]EKG85400.1 hypothetical protein VCHE16_2833 [Vibrio paracholerae HE-16]MCX9580068.1 DUF2897 family protein [Vibrio cholerae]MCX9583127.1 DUF2897 family protein [Vibrio cholerae]GHW23345.1 hypothetical protein VCSRO193_1332 [Vibrio cholerae]
MEILFNPWVISLIVVAVIVGNIAALKYTANMKFGQIDKKSELDRLNELDQQRYPRSPNGTDSLTDPKDNG